MRIVGPLALLLALGVTAQEPPVIAITNVTVIDATGAIPVMNRTIDFVRKGGTVLLFGVPPSGRTLEFEGFKIFQKGLKILSSFTSVRNSFQAVGLLQSGQIQVGSLISHHLPLEDMPHALELIESRDPAVKKVLVHPNG